MCVRGRSEEGAVMMTRNKQPAQSLPPPLPMPPPIVTIQSALGSPPSPLCPLSSLPRPPPSKALRRFNISSTSAVDEY